MEESYDVIVLGTGLTECIISGLLSVEGKKVLHLDRNNYYGGDCASLNLTQLYEKFGKSGTPSESFGRPRDYNIDLVPKFSMSAGDFVQILIYTDVTKYFKFKQIDGSYVYQDGKIVKVPATEKEALTTSIFSLSEKNNLRKLFEFIQKYNIDDPSTTDGLDWEKVPMKDIYKKFNLENSTCDLCGHALALYFDDDYLEKPFKETFQKIVLYMNSVTRYGKSPFIYPLYGLGELSQGFARLSAIYGGTYMINTKVDEIVYENGIATGIKSDGKVAKASTIIGDPSYFKDKVQKKGQVIRAIYLLKHPLADTNNADSSQIIIPQKQLNRQHDIYITCVSNAHKVAAPNHYIAMVSTIIETANPEEEIAEAVKLLGDYEEKFIEISDLYEPLADGTADHVYISKSYDATSHFETVSDDVKDLYHRVTGKTLSLEGKLRKDILEDDDE